RNQFNAGLVPPNDVSSVEAQESRQRMLTVQARSTRDVAEAELGRLIGLDPGASIRPASSLAPPVPEALTGAVQSVLALVEQARAARAERAALQKHVIAADE